VTAPRVYRRLVVLRFSGHIGAVTGPLAGSLLIAVVFAGTARGGGSAPAGQVAFSKAEDIWVARPDGSHARRVVRARGPQDDPSWAPDGRRFVYRDSRLGYNIRDEIYLASTDGSPPRNLTRSMVNEWGPAWSPDGRLIAYNSDTRLYVMRPDGTRKRQVAGIEAEYPAWSPDGRRLAFMSLRAGSRGNNPDYDIYVVDLDGSGLRRLTNWPGEEGWPAWSPDGASIAFTTTRDDRGQFHGGGPYVDTYVMRSDGSAKRRIVKEIFGSFPAWSPDGRFILFTGSALSELAETLWVVRRDGSDRRPLGIAGSLADWSAR
jgi:Tol biopolymer transport system component